MSYIKINQAKVTDVESLKALCPFGAIEADAGNQLSINAACRMCKICTKKSDGVFEFIEDNVVEIDKSQWQNIAVLAEIENNNIHPITFELLGKAKDLAQKIGQKVYVVMVGYNVINLADKLLKYGADEVFVYDQKELECFRIEPYTRVIEDFINLYKPASMLIGGTVSGRSLAPRCAVRFKTGLTADCTILDISESTNLDQIRPACGGNIMAHINTPNHRPQFATVRYKIFAIPQETESVGKVTRCTIDPSELSSQIEILERKNKELEVGIEEAEVLIVAGRGIKKAEDIELLNELALLLNGRVGSTRAFVEAGFIDPRYQIGLSGRTVKPKLIITCGVSGAIQFVAGMNNSEFIVAINSDPNAAIFNVAHVKMVGDLYTIVPAMIENIKRRKAERV